LAACYNFGPLLSLPEVQKPLAVCLIMVVGKTNGRRPSAATSIRNTDDPSPCGLVTPVAKGKAGADADKHRLLGNTPVDLDPRCRLLPTLAIVISSRLPWRMRPIENIAFLISERRLRNRGRDGKSRGRQAMPPDLVPMPHGRSVLEDW